MNLPKLEEIEYKKYYDLSKRQFDFKQSETSEHNQDILEQIVEEFAAEFKIAPSVAKEVLNIEWAVLRTTEPILVLYNLKGTDDVHKTYVNANMSWFKELFG